MKNIYSNKKILLSGSTGFLGNIIKETLSNRFQIKTIGKNNSDYLFDFSNSNSLIINESFDLIIHTAGKAHSIPKTSSEKDEFYQINYEGTNRFLIALEKSGSIPKSLLYISSVAVYGLLSGNNVDENSPLNANDPYGKSKILAEKAVENWCLEHNVICTILRLPLLIGKNPKGNLKAMIAGINKGYYVNIDGGTAKKSMVLAADVADFIPKVAEIGGIYNLTDGYHPNFQELSSLIANQLGKNIPINIPKSLILFISKLGDLLGSLAPINSEKYIKITSNLTFDDKKARELGGWNPTPVLKGFEIN